jgi:hypothetical protein
MAHFFERPDGLQRGKIFEQLYFHASGLSPAFLQAFMVAIQSRSNLLSERVCPRFARTRGQPLHSLACVAREQVRPGRVYTS